MPPLSALSAALAHPDAPEDKSRAETVTTAAWEALHRNVAFPCLRYARPDDVRVQEVTGFEKVDITTTSFPGTSVTTSSLQAGPGSLVSALPAHKP